MKTHRNLKFAKIPSEGVNHLVVGKHCDEYFKDALYRCCQRPLDAGLCAGLLWFSRTENEAHRSLHQGYDSGYIPHDSCRLELEVLSKLHFEFLIFSKSVQSRGAGVVTCDVPTASGEEVLVGV